METFKEEGGGERKEWDRDSDRLRRFDINMGIDIDIDIQSTKPSYNLEIDNTFIFIN